MPNMVRVRVCVCVCQTGLMAWCWNRRVRAHSLLCCREESTKMEAWCLFLSTGIPMCVTKCMSGTVRDRQQVLYLHQTHFQCTVSSILYIPGRTFLWNKRGLHLHVETAMPAGTLMLLLMTAKTLTLYSTPASRPEMVQEVVLPGILISNGTPDTETGMRERQSVYIHMPFLWSRLDVLCLPPVLLGVYVTKKSVSTTEPSHSRSTLRSVPPRIFRFMTGATKIIKNFRYVSNIIPPFVHYPLSGQTRWQFLMSNRILLSPSWFFSLLRG